MQMFYFWATSLLEGEPNKRLIESDIVCNELNQVVGC